jgi:hypothetical protein
MSFPRANQTNTDKCSQILLSQHFINTIRHSKTLQPLKGHLQRVYLKHSSSKLNKMISNFRRVLNVVLFLLGNSPASEF